MIVFSTFDSIEDAWVGVLRAAEATRDGRLLHTVVAVAQPTAPDPQVVAVNDSVLRPRGDYLVDTVANTLFPGNSYAAPSFDFHPAQAPAATKELDDAAEDLYEQYREALPDLCSFQGNERGTYFGRMVSWPGKTSDGYNQLRRRVEQLRGHRKLGESAANAADLTFEGIAEVESGDAAALQIYKSDDERQRGFPCLVHIDISVVDGKLNLMALYRHWHLVHKAYGNLIGLARLMHFLAQQTGYEPGELMIHATVANAEIQPFSHRMLKRMIGDADAAMSKQQELI